MQRGAVSVLVLSGSMGAGKTTVLGEASDLLAVRKVVHAAIDLDTLSIGCFRGDLEAQNFAAVWRNYAAAGVDRLLLAVADVDRERIGQAVPGAKIVVCRLRASVETMQKRVRLREPGMRQSEFVQRTAELERTIGGEDFSVGNDGRDITEVAREVLVRAGWL